MYSQDIRIGTSGWSYPHWKGVFYPLDIPADQWLAYYGAKLQSVEINSSFYRLPTQNALRHWRDTVRDDFVFSVKASRYITHMKKLKAPEKVSQPLLDAISTLEHKLGPVLFQLPPHWHFDEKRLEAFLPALDTGFRYVFEFRDPSWFNSRCYAILRNYTTAFCIYDLGGRLSPKIVTTDFVYIRLHGPGAPYQGNYPDSTLIEWADTISRWSDAGLSVYCYFNNDQFGYAVNNAMCLQQLLGLVKQGD